MTLAQQYLSTNIMLWELDPASHWQTIGDISITTFTDNSVAYLDHGSEHREPTMWWGFAGRGYINHPTTDY